MNAVVSKCEKKRSGGGKRGAGSGAGMVPVTDAVAGGAEPGGSKDGADFGPRNRALRTSGGGKRGAESGDGYGTSRHGRRPSLEVAEGATYREIPPR